MWIRVPDKVGDHMLINLNMVRNFYQTDTETVVASYNEHHETELGCSFEELGLIVAQREKIIFQNGDLDAG